jgi:hydroxymethylpyrimidine/phosphomethylpyrimidine kinase
VLCLSGHDPTGGAGIHADIEAIAAQGGHALTVITANTVQDTHNVRRVSPLPPMLIAQQLEALVADCRIGAVKIGLLGDADQLAVILPVLRGLAVPVVYDPVLRAGGGANLVSTRLQAAVLADLLPAVSLLTPNAAEARRLAPGADSLDACAERLLQAGCGAVLVTGGDEPGETVTNTLHRAEAAPRPWNWPRLPQTFHGAGCTLASAIAGRLARGEPLAEAVEAGQRWTQGTLAAALRIGQGRAIPGRSVQA